MYYVYIYVLYIYFEEGGSIKGEWDNGISDPLKIQNEDYV